MGLLDATTLDALEVQNAKSQLQHIQQALAANHIGLPQAMLDLHKNMLQNEFLAHMMSDEELAMLVKAHESYENLVVAAAEAKPKSTASLKKKINGMVEL